MYKGILPIFIIVALIMLMSGCVRVSMTPEDIAHAQAICPKGYVLTSYRGQISTLTNGATFQFACVKEQ